MAENPCVEPITIASGLEDLAEFLRSAGFCEAASLVDLAALSASDEIFHARAVVERLHRGMHPRRRNGKATT